MFGHSLFGAVAATHAEARAFRKGLDFLPGGELESEAPCRVERLSDPLDEFAILLAVCGPGPQRAAMAARALLDAGVDGLLCVGIAGGLAPDLECGHMVLADEVVHAGQDTGISPAIRCVRRQEMQHTLRQVEVTARAGTIVTSDLPLCTPSMKAEMHSRTGGLAVDMESHAVARVADENMVLCMVARSIADTAHDTIPKEALKGLGPDGSLNPLAVLPHIFRKPVLSRDLIRLARQSRRALRTLSHAAPEIAYHAKQLLAM